MFQVLQWDNWCWVVNMLPGTTMAYKSLRLHSLNPGTDKGISLSLLCKVSSHHNAGSQRVSKIFLSTTENTNQTPGASV